MNLPRPIILLSGPEDDAPIEVIMKFRLQYRGELRPTGRDPIGDQPDPLAAHKHRIRQCFHGQLKELWATNKFLSTHQMSIDQRRPSRPIGDEKSYWGGEERFALMREVIADENRRFGYRFLPLVREEISLLCSISILLLRRDPPGTVLSAGDIDNRLKTLIDGMRLPQNATELAGNTAPLEGEDPFYCLLEDDKQISHLEVETDVLLEPPLLDKNMDRRQVSATTTVELRPYYMTNFSLSFY